MSAESNDQLQRLLGEANWSRKALARAVNDLADARGVPISCDHTTIGRWLAGMQPREATARILVDVLSRRLGRSLTGEDAGLTPSRTHDPATGLDYASPSPGTALANLLTADAASVRAITDSDVVSSAWTQAALAWLVRVSDRDRAPAVHSVGLADVEALRATTKAFSELDNRFGGQHARRSLATFLSDGVKPLLDAHHRDEAGRQLFQAAAEATLLLAWMTYDACSHGLAQRYFIQALRLADVADDAVLAGSILDAMSHQARFVGRFSEAATLARAALTGSAGKVTATQKAHFFAMEARAHAGAGDAAATDRAVSSMLVNFGRRRDDEAPEWLSYVDDGELAAELAHCFRDLGRHSEAIKFATMATEYAGASARSDFFVTMVLADAQLASGELEQACETAATALSFGQSLKSARAIRYVRDFRRRLGEFAEVERLDTLLPGVSESGLWNNAS